MYYRLEGKKVIPCSLEDWASPYGRDESRVGGDTVGEFWVSTVFFGTDMGIRGAGVTLLVFETMIFRSQDAEDRDEFPELFNRYGTWEEAEQGHWDACQNVRSRGGGE